MSQESVVSNYYADSLHSFYDEVKDLENDVVYTKFEDFQVLLSAVYSLIDGSDFVNIQMQDASGTAANRSKVDEDLRKFGIIDEETAMMVISKACMRGMHWQYAQFQMHDSGNFEIELEKMSEKGRESFLKCHEFSSQFNDLVGKTGYFAWDIALAVHLIREALFCDYYNEYSAREMLDDLCKPLLKTFSDWPSFALSFIAGGTYSAYKNSGFDEEEARKTFDYLLEKCNQLFTDERVSVWKAYHWYVKKDYFPMLDKDNLKPLINSEKGCFVSDRISVEGAIPCMIYREKPFKNFPDSGWRFFAGDESKEYSADRNNSNIFTLNVICNYDESVIPLLDAEVGTVYIRKDGGDFIESKLDMKEMADELSKN